MTNADPQWLDDDAAIRALADRIGRLPPTAAVALDTEFTRISTYYPRLDLLQLELDGQICLVDPYPADLTPLWRALRATAAEVLIFSGHEDLEIIATACRRAALEPAGLPQYRDPQLLAAFCGEDGTRGLGAMLAECLGVTLLKEATRSDWSARPLSRDQIDYAAADVRHLAALYRTLRRRCPERQFGWFVEECRRRHDLAVAPTPPELLYRQVDGAGALNAAALGRLQFICCRRAEYARAQDVAPNHLITGGALCRLAARCPDTPQRLADCGVKWGTIRAHGRLILEWLDAARRLPPAPDLEKPYDYFAARRERQDYVRRLRARLAERAAALGLQPELLSQKKLLQDLLHARAYGRTPVLLQGWRAAAAAAVVATVDEEAADVSDRADPAADPSPPAAD